MALFNFFNYDKPGPGIEKDAPPQKAVPRFFSILGRKFTALIQLNLLFCIPAAITFFLSTLIGNATHSAFMAVLPFLLLSPFVAGLTIVTRNYAREEHAFIFYDFKNSVKENWKAFFLNGIVCYALYFIFSVSIQFYASKSGGNLMFLIATAVCCVLAVMAVFAQYYVPVMIVTFDLKLRQIYKNALIFAVIGLWRNILLTVFLAALVLGLYCLSITMLTTLIGFLLVVLVLFSFVMYLINFAVYPLIDKMMIQPQKKEEEPPSDEDIL